MLIITDSLGCARPDVGIPIEKTWTSRIIQDFSSIYDIFTIMQPGLTVNRLNPEFINEYDADVIICQVGIVDASRRALGGIEQKVFSKIPIIGRIVHLFVKNHHYFLTKIRNIHYADIDTYKNKIASIIRSSKHKTIFIAIAPPGEFLVRRTYNIEEDIRNYNNSVKMINNEKLFYLNPYKNGVEGVLLDDGHHLTAAGNDMVLSEVSRVLQELT